MAKMIKVVFLIGKAKEILVVWEEEKTAKKERIFFKEKGICGFKAIEAAIIDRNDVEENYCFHFLIIPEKRIRSIPKIMEKMNIEIKEAISVVSTDLAVLKLINGEKRKRYCINPECGWVVYFKNGIKTRDINEFVAVFFRETIHKELYNVIREEGKNLLKKSNNPAILSLLEEMKEPMSQ